MLNQLSHMSKFVKSKKISLHSHFFQLVAVCKGLIYLELICFQILLKSQNLSSALTLNNLSEKSDGFREHYFCENM